jgi:hypothetical protein
MQEIKLNGSGKERSRNYITNLYSFIQNWDAQLERHSKPLTFKVSELGNINVDGSINSFTSTVLTRWHPSFEASIEPGVRECVLLCVERLNCITYTSCQGHPTYEPDRFFSLRHVSIVPRSKIECEGLTAYLTHMATSVNAVLPSDLCVRVVITSRVIYTNDGPNLEGIDIVFGCRDTCQSDYFRSVEAVYTLFCEGLRKSDLSKLNLS